MWSLDLDDDRLELYPLGRLKNVEGQLKIKGLITQKKGKTVDKIFAFRLNFLSLLGKGVFKHNRNYPLRGAQ